MFCIVQFCQSRVTAFARFGLVAALLLAAFGSAAPAGAETITQVWTISKNWKYAMVVRFFQKDGTSTARIWPNTNESWVMNQNKVNFEYRLSCTRGVNICFGAAPQGGSWRNYWGVGIQGNEGCQSCCHICNDDTVSAPELYMSAGFNSEPTPAENSADAVEGVAALLGAITGLAVNQSTRSGGGGGGGMAQPRGSGPDQQGVSRGGSDITRRR